MDIVRVSDRMDRIQPDHLSQHFQCFDNGVEPCTFCKSGLYFFPFALQFYQASKARIPLCCVLVTMKRSDSPQDEERAPAVEKQYLNRHRRD
jgi:hypothetical protein